MMYYDEPELIRLFDVVREFTLAACGDGDGWIVSQENWKNYAELFEIVENRQDDPWFTQKVCTENSVCFYHEQESINFVKENKNVHWTDILVEIH